MSNNDVKRALFAYGNAIRGDWSLLDGRVVDNDLRYIADCIDTDTPLDAMLANLEIVEVDGSYEWA